jgi:hypothetical protein
MPNPDLPLSQIQDPYVREAFKALLSYLEPALSPLAGFALVDVNLGVDSDSFSVKHGLGFVPQDVIVLTKEPEDASVIVRLDQSTRDDLVLEISSTVGGARFRALVGTFGRTPAPNTGTFVKSRDA